jgi:hypothetical protein
MVRRNVMVTKSNGLQPIRLRIDIDGEFHNQTHPRKGSVVDVEKQHAERYFALGIAQPAEVELLGEAYRPYRGAA